MSINKVVYSGRTLIDLSSDTITSDKMLENTTAHSKGGSKITGTIKNNGKINKTIDGINQTSVTIPAGYTTGGTVSLTKDIEQALSSI